MLLLSSVPESACACACHHRGLRADPALEEDCGSEGFAAQVWAGFVHLCVVDEASDRTHTHTHVMFTQAHVVCSYLMHADFGGIPVYSAMRVLFN